MSSCLDGCAVLAAIAHHSASFPALKGEIDTTARKLLVKQLRAASLELEVFGQMIAAVGEPSIRMCLDELGPKDIVSIAHRLDPANTSLSAMNEIELGEHLFALGRGEAKPTPGKKIKARAGTKKPPKELSKIGEVLNSKVHSGRILRPATTAPKPPREKGRNRSG